jgi:hypothetical protein
MVIPGALSRDTMNKDLTLCARCLKTVGSEEKELTRMDILRCADLSAKDQWKEFAEVKDMAGERDRFLMGENGLLYRLFTERAIRVVVPKT